VSVVTAVAVAADFVWLGMVIAISFIEAPLKFRAPGVSLQLGLGIGRLVFRALNTVEAVLAVAILVAVAIDPPSPAVIAAVAGAAVTLAAQVLLVRPALTRRSDAVLAAPAVQSGASRRSRAHYGYVALEFVKVAALVVGGFGLLAA
jgi:hypothetical protein